MEEEHNIIVRWAQEDVETLYSPLNSNNIISVYDRISNGYSCNLYYVKYWALRRGKWESELFAIYSQGLIVISIKSCICGSDRLLSYEILNKLHSNRLFDWY